jgi:hypothetical protein
MGCVYRILGLFAYFVGLWPLKSATHFESGLRIAYCVLRISHCVLRIAYCQLRIAYCVLRIACWHPNTQSALR